MRRLAAKRSWIRKLAARALYLLYVLAFIAVVDYFFFYRPYAERIRDRKSGPLRGRDPHAVELPEARHVDRELMKRLGKAINDKESAFFNFDEVKAAGVVRVCCLGDSFTAGDEVASNLDYPTLLQRRFDQAGARHLEVVNFGVGGFGLQQSYMLWEAVAREFGCDVYLLGPRGFQALRDTTFGFIYHWSPYYLHARYVLDGDDVKLVEVLGDTYGERFDAHFRFLQPWRYLRYSRSTPMFLKALVPKKQDVGNPFYYDRRDMETEARDIQAVLLRKMAASGAPVLVAHYRRPIVELAANVSLKARSTATAAIDLGAARFHEATAFPYVARLTHAGPWGNALLARQYFAALTGQDRGAVTVLELGDLDGAALGAETGPRRSLSSYSRVELALDGVAVGQFSFIDFTGDLATEADALVSVNRPGQSVLDSGFFPVELELQPGMDVTLRVESGGKATDYRLGAVSALRGLNIGLAKVEGFEFFALKDFEHMQDRGEPSPLTHGKRRLRGLFFRGNEDLAIDEIGEGSLTVLVGGQPALVGERGEMGLIPGVWFTPLEKERFRIPRANATGFVEIDSLDESGTIDVVAEHWEDGVVSVPIASWTKRVLEVPEPARFLEHVLTIAPDGMVLVERRSAQVVRK